MSDYDVLCIDIANIARNEGVSTAIATVIDNGMNYEEAMAILEFMGVIR